MPKKTPPALVEAELLNRKGEYWSEQDARHAASWPLTSG